MNTTPKTIEYADKIVSADNISNLASQRRAEGVYANVSLSRGEVWTVLHSEMDERYSGATAEHIIKAAKKIAAALDITVQDGTEFSNVVLWVIEQMEIVTFYTPYFESRLWSMGRVLRQKGSYYTIHVTKGNLAGMETDVHADYVTF